MSLYTRVNCARIKADRNRRQTLVCKASEVAAVKAIPTSRAAARGLVTVGAVRSPQLLLGPDINEQQSRAP